MKKLIPILMLTLMLCGCGDKAENINQPVKIEDVKALNGGEIRLFCDEPDTLNPIVTGYKSVASVMHMVYEGLFKTENDFSATPVLSTGYSTDNGNTKYIVRLKKGVKFHDGTTFGPEDVIATLDNIRGTQSIYNVNLQNVSGYGVQDDGSVFFNLVEPQSNFVNLLDFPILPSEVRQSDCVTPNKSFIPNGTGKFKIDSIDDKSVVLVKSNSYHGEDMYLEKVCISYVQDRSVVKYSFDAKEFDMITTDLYSWGDTSMAGDFSTNEYESNRMTLLGFDCRNVILSDSGVRRAISYAIDKSQIVSEIMYSHAAVADTPINPNAYFSNREYIPSPFEKGVSREKFKDIGWLDFDGDNILDKYFGDEKLSLSFNLLVNSQNQTCVKLAEYLAKSLLEEGISLNVVSLPYEEYVSAVVSGDFDMFIGRVDILNDCNVAFMLSGSGSQNYFGYSSSEMDGALHNISISTDSHNVKSAYKSFDDVFKNEMPFVPFYFETDALFVSLRIKGELDISRTGVFTGLNNAFVKFEQ